MRLLAFLVDPAESAEEKAGASAEAKTDESDEQYSHEISVTRNTGTGLDLEFLSARLPYLFETPCRSIGVQPQSRRKLDVALGVR
jgi:hypothetical protein